MTTATLTDATPRRIARGAGFFWLMTIITSAFAYTAGANSLVPGDAGATAANIMGNESLYRFAFAANLIATICYLVATLLVYVLLRPVNRYLSLLAAFFSLIGCAVGAVSCLLFIAPISILGTASSLPIEQLQSQALTFLTLSARANDVGLVFFGLHVLSVSYLIIRSGFLPKILGALLACTGVCYLTNSFAIFLALPFKVYLLPFVAAGGLLGEGALTIWLLIAGVNVAQWFAKAAATSNCSSPCALGLEPAN
jgi:hypothetical protein